MQQKNPAWRNSALAFSIAMALVSGNAGAVTAYGTLSNFDVYNDSPDAYYGFEIELEGLHKSAIPTYLNNGIETPAVFQVPGGYLPSLEEIIGPTGFSTIIRYSAFDLAANQVHITTPFDPTNPRATDGHSCVFASGCEHFGAGYYGNPSAVRYQWLLKGAAPGTANLVKGPIVNLGNPVWNYNPAPNPEVQPQLNVEVDPPEQENEGDVGPARWVKTFVSKAHKDADVVHDAQHPEDPGMELQARLDALVSGSDHHDVVPQGQLDQDGNEVPEEEFEWELLAPNEASSSHGDAVLADDDVQVARRFEFYDFVANGLATLELCSHQQGNQPECDPEAHPELVGNLLGAQMGAINFDLIEPAPVPLPATLPLLLAASAALGTLGRRRAKA